MPAKQIPYGVSDYKKIIEEERAYVDKTMYIRFLEDAGDYLLFLRPRRFGKSLFASTLGYYYDIAQKDNFDLLFSGTDIGRNPTARRNTYYVLKFDFSDIETDSDEIVLESFTNKIYDALLTFCDTYHLDLNLKMGRPAAQLSTFFREFRRTCDGKIYIIIDEYDNFTNELLSSNLKSYKKIISRDGFVRKWYAGLKLASGTIVDRIFITGVSPITVDSLISGFNISENLSMDRNFNEMMGFTKSEVEHLIKETILPEELPSDLMDTLTEYYNGYCFSKNGQIRVFNSDMVLYYLKSYQRYHEPPDTLLDYNAVSDYKKLENLITFENPMQNREILKKIVSDGYIIAKLSERFSIGRKFGEEDFKSLLFYLGLLTIKDSKPGYVKLQIPNTAMNGLYLGFLTDIISKETNYAPSFDQVALALDQLAYENSCEKLTEFVEGYLASMSNRDDMNFSEKEVKQAMMIYAGMSDLYLVKSEYEVQKKYIDFILLPLENTPELNTQVFELKYLKKKEVPDPTSEAGHKKIAEKLAEAEGQIKKYISTREFLREKTTAWVIVFVGEKCVKRVNVPVR
ncbi:MAG: ATP-binding protein [Methanomicrobiales archaeon]|jgi:hypothetical protein|nr:ATP-binding protein [Methanomicrobiales archaeon]